MPEEALRVVYSWGFTPKSEIVWIKFTPGGKLHFGMGRTVRAAHETCMIATRGRPQRKSASVRSIFDAVVGKHSAKPEEFYDLVESLYDGPYAELFARRVRPGWSCFGNDPAVNP
jgi:N6-adenosine-specific RNA methylase IME4